MKLSVAVIGTGRNGSRFVLRYNEHPSVGSIVIADPFEKSRKEFAKLDKVKADYASAEEMLDKEKVDLISVHTPGPLHAPYFIRACELKTHIFVEKPFATKLEDIRAMVQAAKGNPGRKMAVGHNYRGGEYNPHIKRLIEDGAMGEIVCIRCGYISDYMYYWQTEPQGQFVDKTPVLNRIRPMFEGATHLIDLANWFIGSGAESVYSVRKPIQAGTVQADWIGALFRYPSSAMLHLDASFAMVAPHQHAFGLQVYGTEGSIRDGVLYRHSSKQYHLREFEKTPLQDSESEDDHGFDREVDAVIDAIVDDTPVPVTVNEGAEAAIGAVAAEESAFNPGQVVAVPDIHISTP